MIMTINNLEATEHCVEIHDVDAIIVIEELINGKYVHVANNDVWQKF